MNYPTNLTLQSDDGETAYFEDVNGNSYCIGYSYIDKSQLRTFADIQPIDAFKNEDGEMCFEYDDDRWDVEFEIIERYVADYIKKKLVIKDNVSQAENGELFRVVENE